MVRIYISHHKLPTLKPYTMSPQGPDEPFNKPPVLRCRKELEMEGTVECVGANAPTSSGGFGATSRTNAAEEGPRIVFDGEMKLKCVCKLQSAEEYGDDGRDSDDLETDAVETGDCEDGKKEFTIKKHRWTYLCTKWHRVDYGPDHGGEVWEVAERIRCQGHKTTNFNCEISMEDAKKAVSDKVNSVYDAGRFVGFGFTGGDDVDAAKECGLTSQYFGTGNTGADGEEYVIVIKPDDTGYPATAKEARSHPAVVALVDCMVGNICCGDGPPTQGALSTVQDACMGKTLSVGGETFKYEAGEIELGRLDCRNPPSP